MKKKMISNILKAYVNFHKIKSIKINQKVFNFQKNNNMERYTAKISPVLSEDNLRFLKSHK